MSSVAKYLKSKGTYVPRTLAASPLVHKNIIDKLQAFETLSLFHLKSHPSQLPIIRAHWNDLDDAVALFLPPGSCYTTSGDSTLAHLERSSLGVQLEPQWGQRKSWR